MQTLIKKTFSTLEKRTWLVLFSAGISGVARLIGFIFTLYITPKIYRSLGQEEFGVWSIILQLVTLAAFADFGLGNGLLTRLNQTRNNDQKEAYIASAFFLLCGISVTLVLLGELAILIYKNYMPFDHFKNNSISSESILTLQIFILIFCLILPFSIIQKVQFSNFDNRIFHIWEIFDKSLAILAVTGAVFFRGKLTLIFSAFYLPTFIAHLLNFLSYKKGLFKRIALSIRRISREKIIDLLMIGRSFFFLTLIFNLSRGTDGILLAYISNLTMVADYQLPLRLFDLILVVTMLFSSALWSGYTNAITSKDGPWIKSALLGSIAGATLLTATIGGALAVYGDQAVSAWTGTNFSIATSAYYGLLIWTWGNTLVNVLSAYLNARTKIKAQLWMCLCFGVIGTPLKIIGFSFYGLSGFIFANSVSLIFCILLPSAALVYQDYCNFKNETQAS